MINKFVIIKKRKERFSFLIFIESSMVGSWIRIVATSRTRTHILEKLREPLAHFLPLPNSPLTCGLARLPLLTPSFIPTPHTTAQPQTLLWKTSPTSWKGNHAGILALSGKKSPVVDEKGNHGNYLSPKTLLLYYKEHCETIIKPCFRWQDKF